MFEFFLSKAFKFFLNGDIHCIIHPKCIVGSKMLDEVVLKWPKSFRYMLENCQTLDAKKRTSRSILPRYLIQPTSVLVFPSVDR